jgi:hypothetical protein
MVVITGFELSKNSWLNQRSAHILGLGVKEFMSADGDIVDLARGIRAQGGVAIAAHPLSTGKFEPQTFHLWSRREELKAEFDAWEVASGQKWSPEVEASGLPMIATSDLHRPSQINSWKTLFSCERSQEAVFDAIKTQAVQFTYYQEPAVESHSSRWIRKPRTHRLGSRPEYGSLGHVAYS